MPAFRVSTGLHLKVERREFGCLGVQVFRCSGGQVFRVSVSVFRVGVQGLGFGAQCFGFGIKMVLDESVVG